MKSLTLALSAAALIALAASPALSASRHHVRHHYGAYRSYAPLNAGGVYSGGPIYRQGRYLGNDPDPHVRFEIARDPYFGRK